MHYLDKNWRSYRAARANSPERKKLRWIYLERSNGKDRNVISDLMEFTTRLDRLAQFFCRDIIEPNDRFYIRLKQFFEWPIILGSLSKTARLCSVKSLRIVLQPGSTTFFFLFPSPYAELHDVPNKMNQTPVHFWIGVTWTSMILRDRQIVRKSGYVNRIAFLDVCDG